MPRGIAIVLALLTAVISGGVAQQENVARGEALAEGLTKLADIAYAEIDGVEPQRLMLDIYAPEGAENAPVMLYVHGGGWARGDRSAVARKPEFFCGGGWLFASTNYRLVPEVTPADQVRDIARAVAWLREHAAQYGGDPERIFLMGHSAGAHLVALVSTDPAPLREAGLGLDALSGSIVVDTGTLDLEANMERLGSAAIFRNAFGTVRDFWREVSPLAHVAADTGIPPILVLVQGAQARLENSQRFVDTLIAAGVAAELVYLPDHDHASINRSIGETDADTTEAVSAFLAVQGAPVAVGAGANAVGAEAALERSESRSGTFFELVWSHPRPLAQATALIDIIGNGFPDLMIASKRYAHLIINDGRSGYSHGRTYRTDRVNGWGVHDFNADGRLDLFVAQPAGEIPDTWLNEGDGTFLPIDLGNETLGTTRNAVFADFDGDGLVDSYHSVSAFGTNHHGSQLHRGLPDGRFGPDIIDSVLDPPVPDFWYRTVTTPEGNEERWANKQFKGAVVRDLDGDGLPELITAAYADRGFQDPRFRAFAMNFVEEQDRGVFLLHNRSTPGEIRFTEVAREALGEDAWGDTPAHMNVYSVIPIDYDRDGDFDLLVGAQLRPGGRGEFSEDNDIVRLHENVSTPGELRFIDRTKEAGLQWLNDLPVDVRREINFASGAAVDIDNDGFVDIILVNRRGMDRTRFAHLFVFRNLGDGTFEYLPPEQHGLGSGSGGRDLVCGDLNGNGMIDVVVNDGTVGGHVGLNNTRIYENRVVNDNRWLQFRVIEDARGVFAFGATVRVYQVGTDHLLGFDEVRTDFCFRSKRWPVMHFGLGEHDSVDLRVSLGSQEVSVENVATNRQVTLDLSTGEIDR